MKDCRYVDDDFIVRYEVVDDEIFVYYKDGKIDNFLYNVMLERKIGSTLFTGVDFK